MKASQELFFGQANAGWKRAMSSETFAGVNANAGTVPRFSSFHSASPKPALVPPPKNCLRDALRHWPSPMAEVSTKAPFPMTENGARILS